jgi:uncharacterized protein (DUF302 family)
MLRRKQMQSSDLGITTTLNLPYEEAVEKVVGALKEEGFGVLTEIDVKKTIKEKLGIDVEKYIILGACNPPLAHRALSADPFVGLLLPCNVIVFEKEGTSVVSAIDPIGMIGDTPNEALRSVANEVRPKLERVIRKLG